MSMVSHQEKSCEELKVGANIEAIEGCCLLLHGLFSYFSPSYVTQDHPQWAGPSYISH